MKKIIFVVFALIFSINAQVKPELFSFDKNLSKIQSTVTSNPLSNSINDILIVRDTIWVGTTRGLSYSSDSGITWTNFWDTEEFGTESIIAIEEHDGILFVSTGHNEADPLTGDDVITGSGIKITTNGGQTWVSIPQSVDDPSDSLITYGNNTLRILPVTVEQQNVTYDLAVYDKYLYTTSWAGNLRRAVITDLLTLENPIWERVVLPPDFLDSIQPSDDLHFTIQAVAGAFGPDENLNHVAFAVIVNDSNHIYVGTADGINKSTDGGLSWRKFNFDNQTNSISGNFITALSYDYNKKTVWASTWQATDLDEKNGASYSTDGGLNWTRVLENEKPHGFGFKYYSENGFDKSDVFVATSTELFRSDDNGLTWTVPNSIYDTESSTFIEDASYYSVDSRDLENGEQEIWVGTSNGLARLTETSAWNGDWKIFYSSVKLDNKNSTYAFPTPFNPNFRNVKIKYEVINTSQNITIRIYDFNMQLVKTVIQNAPRNLGERIENWDGNDENGNVVPNGVYFYKINRNDEEPIFGKIMVVR